MKKSIYLITLALICATFLIFSFTSGNENKEYVSIFYSSNDLIISSSNGTYKRLKADKMQGTNDRTQLLEMVTEYESNGYQLENFDLKYPAGNNIVFTADVLLSK